jgi:hypothetical protein
MTALETLIKRLPDDKEIQQAIADAQAEAKANADALVAAQASLVKAQAIVVEQQGRLDTVVNAVAPNVVAALSARAAVAQAELDEFAAKFPKAVEAAVAMRV